MVRFWRDWNVVAAAEARDRHRVREADIKHLVRLGRVEKAFASPDLLASAAKKLASLLPDAHVPNMLQREPAVLHLNFVRASQSILELQEVLCDVDKCTDVTPVIDATPSSCCATTCARRWLRRRRNCVGSRRAATRRRR